MLRSRYFILAAAIVVIAAAQAQAQPDPSLKPTYGTIDLKAGFTPDPFTKAVVSGGQQKTKLGGVNAFVAKAPDFRLNYTKGKWPLLFHVKSAGDTTLLINLPDGTWIANDDGGGGLDPLIRIEKPESGQYDIFVGSFKNELIESTLYISEIGFEKEVFKQPPPKGNQPDCHVLSVGIDKYVFLNKLSGDVNDARNTAAAFKNQMGGKFKNVTDRLLLDGAGTRQAIVQGLEAFTKQGKAGDYMVLFLSGHGDRMNNKNTWFFCPVDFNPKNVAGTALTDKQILDVGDALVKQKKNFVIVIDACHSGQLNTTAQSYMNRYKNANEGGLIVMVACQPDQTSAALGNYSTFAKAFSDAMAGNADLKKNGHITLAEMQSYCRTRTTEIVTAARQPKQDAIVSWSPSYSSDTPFAYTRTAFVAAKPEPVGKSTKWNGNEDLAGYGKLSFTMYGNGRVVMVDAKDTSEGLWRKQGNQYTMSFSNGAVVYSGMLNGDTISGTATSPGQRQGEVRSWKWSVRQ